MPAVNANKARELARRTERVITTTLTSRWGALFKEDIQRMREDGCTLHFAREYVMYQLYEGYFAESYDPLHVVSHCPLAFLIGSGLQLKVKKHTQPGVGMTPELTAVDKMMHELREELNRRYPLGSTCAE